MRPPFKSAGRGRREDSRRGLPPIRAFLGLLALALSLIGGCDAAEAPPRSPQGDAAAPPAAERVESPAPSPGDTLSLLEAAFAGQADRTRQALDQGADPNTRGGDGRTALMLAAFDGHTETVRLLLEHGAKVDDRDGAGRTALMYAASGPNQETVRVLLENQADPLAVDQEEHFTALMFAAAEGHTEIVRMLLSHGSDPSMVDVDGDTAIDFATKNGHQDVADLLRDSKT